MNERIRKVTYSSLGLALLTYAVVNWVKTIQELRRFYTNMWIWDQWNYLAHFDAYRHLDLSVFWIQHNEHRVIGTELVYVIDMFLFHGRQVFPEIIGIAAYIAVLLVMFSFAWFWGEDKWSTACAAFLVTGIAGYKLCVVSLASPFLTCWPQWEFFSIASLAAIALHKRRGGKLMLILGILFAVASTYSLANGMLLWPLLLLAGLLLGFSLRELAVIFVAALVSVGAYFFHYINLHTGSPATLLHNPKYLAMFLGSFLGMPFAAAFHLSPNIIYTSICGWMALLIALIDLLWIIWKKLFTRPSVVVLAGFCLLVLTSALLTASGRMDPIDTSIQAARAGRYITEPTLFWCALLMLTVVLIGRAGKGYAAFLFLAAAGVLSWRTLPKSTDYYNAWTTYFQRGQWAAIGFGNGITDNSVGDLIFPSREYLAQFKHVLVDNHLAIFSGPEPGWIGRQASQVFTLGSDGYIHGAVTTVKKLGQDYEVQGWADGVTRVVFVDQTNRIVGFGMRPKAGVSDIYSHDVPAALAFTGFIRGEFGAHDFSVWAVDRKGRQIYRMGRLTNALPQADQALSY